MGYRDYWEKASQMGVRVGEKVQLTKADTQNQNDQTGTKIHGHEHTIRTIMDIQKKLHKQKKN